MEKCKCSGKSLLTRLEILIARKVAGANVELRYLSSQQTAGVQKKFDYCPYDHPISRSQR